ncbi:universal stress protein [Stakelama marina]|uniref:Universal stress protein n=1 Tax=Stakelama marina TaxID=2826939 RepID=A0A8T4IFL9_9SPHN|nr:universal stress protein [Stakelama marina]MBR0551049.1 hypothetical protein [Stakelama marina]
MKSLLVPLFDDGALNHRVDAADALARGLDAHIMFAEPPGSSRSPPQTGAASDVAPLSDTDAAALARLTTLSDLVIVPSVWRPSRPTGPSTADIITHCFAPLLAMPSSARIDRLPETAIIAWSDTSPTTALALKAAIPLLAHAAGVKIVSVGGVRDDDGAINPVDYLRWHGIAADFAVLPRSGRVSDTLHDAAREIDAELIVMGAYGRGRFLEDGFGGITRRMLEITETPLLLHPS